MTPTLLGRIETRLALLVAVGVPLALIVAGLSAGVTAGAGLLGLLVIGLLGVAWECAYHALQQLRLDKDWPSIAALGAGALEASLAWPVLGLLGLQPTTAGAYAVLFGTVWLGMWLTMQGPLRVLAPQWRFRGMRFAWRPITAPSLPALPLARRTVRTSTPTPEPVPVRRAVRPARTARSRAATSALVSRLRASITQWALVTTAFVLGVGVAGVWLLARSLDGGSPDPAGAQETSVAQETARPRVISEQRERPESRPRTPNVVRNTWDTTVRVEPTVLTVGRLGLRSELDRIGLRSTGTMETPEESSRAGWYTPGTAPGEKGPAVIIGDMSGAGAVFADMAALTPGDPIVVTRRDGTKVTFVVDRVQRVGFAQFPTESVYGATARPTLRLIGFRAPSGTQDGENVIVYATARTLTTKPAAG